MSDEMSDRLSDMADMLNPAVEGLAAGSAASAWMLLNFFLVPTGVVGLFSSRTGVVGLKIKI